MAGVAARFRVCENEALMAIDALEGRMLPGELE